MAEDGETEEDVNGREKHRSGGETDDTIGEDRKSTTDTHPSDDEEEDKEGLRATVVVRFNETRTATEGIEDTGMVDAMLTVLVRMVLASVWIAVVLGWVLERISDVLAFVIELGLVWMPHRDGSIA